MTDFISLTATVSVAGRLTPDDIARAAADGFRVAINNRPDGEEPGQATETDLREAAEAAGMAYRFIPVSSGFSREQVDAMAEALNLGSPVLAFCRSGTRSANLWALAEASRGGDPDTLVAATTGGGYDVSGLLPTLRSLSAASA